MKVPARVWRAALQPYLTTDFSADLANIAVPTLLVWGDRDAFTGRSEQDESESCDQDVAARGLRRCRSQPALGRAAALRWSGRVVRRGSPFARLPVSHRRSLTADDRGLERANRSRSNVTDKREPIRISHSENQGSRHGRSPSWRIISQVSSCSPPTVASRPKSHYTTALFKAALQRGDRASGR